MRLRAVVVFLAGVLTSGLAISQTWTEQKLVPTGGLSVGIAVAVSGNVAIIGAPATSSSKGAVYVYTRPALCSQQPCTWSLAQTLTAGDGVASDEFGFSLAFDGQTMLIGAPYADVGGRQQQGAAYTFTKSGSTWTQNQKLVSYDGAAGDAFGSSVALFGAHALIGSPDAAIAGNVGQGAAYRFYRAGAVGNNYLQAQKFSADDGGRYEAFGSAVALSDTAAFIGASSAVSYGNWGLGAVYAFEQSCINGVCDPNWPQAQRLVPNDAFLEMMYGNSVAFDGTTVVIGAPYGLWGPTGNCYSGKQTCPQGNAYILSKTGGAWALQQELFGPGLNSQFAASVAIDGARIVVGAPSDGWPSQVGAAYVFDKFTTWSAIKVLSPSDAGLGDYFGGAVGLDGNTTIVGSPSSGTQGAAYSYTKTN
jgi:hypothetical protein